MKNFHLANLSYKMRIYWLKITLFSKLVLLSETLFQCSLNWTKNWYWNNILKLFKKVFFDAPESVLLLVLLIYGMIPFTLLNTISVEILMDSFRYCKYSKSGCHLSANMKENFSEKIFILPWIKIRSSFCWKIFKEKLTLIDKILALGPIW